MQPVHYTTASQDHGRLVNADNDPLCPPLVMEEYDKHIQRIEWIDQLDLVGLPNFQNLAQ